MQKRGSIDSEWSTVGSLNLDTVSLRYNFEANIVSRLKPFAVEIESHFLEDLSHAQLLTHEIWDKRPLYQKILNIILKPLRVIF